MGKSFFSENLAVTTTSYGFLESCQNLEETNGTIPEGQKFEQADPIS